MTTHDRADAPSTDSSDAADSASLPPSSSLPATKPPNSRRELLPLPALAAISLYMVVLAIVDVVSVVGGQFRPIYLVLAALFIAAAAGLVMRFRWAWALTLAAVGLLAGLFFFKFYTDQQFPFIIEGFVNLICFLYLVRPEVREKLR
jgi:hypothetical protein